MLKHKSLSVNREHLRALTLKSRALHFDHVEHTLIKGMYSALDTPVALSCWLLYSSGQHDELAKKAVDPSNYLTADSFFLDFAAVSFLSKYRELRTSYNLSAVALERFREAEHMCELTNRRLKRCRSMGITPVDAGLIFEVQCKIATTLGRFDVASTFDLMRWGPGVNQSRKGDALHAALKYEGSQTATLDLAHLYGENLRFWSPHWNIDAATEESHGNVVCFVPKNAKTDRTIAIEPSLNSFVQLGLGRLIRQRMLARGVNLNSDFRNCDLARIGSLNDNYCTIDFSMASDTISLEVVRELLPPEWFVPLDAARSKYFRDPESDSWTWSQKFSSMGNGATWELESLIFWSIAEVIRARLCLPTPTAIFGDDVVCHTEVAETFYAVCEALGFRVNREKSFTHGPFRESCGTYFFDGQDVKPFFLKEKIRDLDSLFSFLNALVRLKDRANPATISRLERLWRDVVRLIPADLRLWGPRHLGDVVIHSEFPLVNSRPGPHGWDGFLIPTLRVKAKTLEARANGYYLYALRRSGHGADFLRNMIPLRARVQKSVALTFVPRCALG